LKTLQGCGDATGSVRAMRANADGYSVLKVIKGVRSETSFKLHSIRVSAYAQLQMRRTLLTPGWKAAWLAPAFTFGASAL
jgi:hypothetical protein